MSDRNVEERIAKLEKDVKQIYRVLMHIRSWMSDGDAAATGKQQ